MGYYWRLNKKIIEASSSLKYAYRLFQPSVLQHNSRRVLLAGAALRGVRRRRRARRHPALRAAVHRAGGQAHRGAGGAQHPGGVPVRVPAGRGHGERWPVARQGLASRL